MRVLVAEDDVVSRRMLTSFLDKWGYDVSATSDGNEALDELEKPEAPRLVISDWMMPGADGLELCRRIRGNDGQRYTYVIILTTKGQKEDVVRGLEAGADDFLIKPFDHEELRYRVRIGERIIQLEHRIMELASTDPLTGVLNRRVLMDKVEAEIQRCVREHTPLSLILADIDHFKNINDVHGHQAGDHVLRQVAKEFTRDLRSYDLVGRYGGEEFVLCLPGLHDSQAALVAERTRKRIEEMTVLLNVPQPIQVTASLGVASFQLGLRDSVDALIKAADEAMYQAKAQGRNCVCQAKD